MNIFDKFNQSEFTSSKQHDVPFTREKRKAIGEERELIAIENIKTHLVHPGMLLNGLHFFGSNKDEVCEIDGLYVSKDTFYVVEIKSKNFSYLYGNTDTGHWYLEYESKTVKSDNVYRQISRQMRILSENFPRMNVQGCIFINNKYNDFTMDIIGPQPSYITLCTDTIDVCNKLNLYTKSNFELVNEIIKLDRINKKKLPLEWQ